MKKLTSLALLVVALVASYSCQTVESPSPSNGKVTFSLSQKTMINGRIQETPVPASVLFSIKDSKGKSQESMKLSLISFGQSYVSENLELKTGNYQLTQFIVLNESNKIIYAMPLEESDLAKYVTHPLPLDFTVAQNESIQITPQVLSVLPSDKPESFGYASFGFKVVPAKIKFELFSTDDLSKDGNSITFEAIIYRTHQDDRTTVVWDSVFTSMQIKDIPSISKKIVFEKPLPVASNGEEIYAGFKYAIDGVGRSWHYEKVDKGAQYATVSFNFK